MNFSKLLIIAALLCAPLFMNAQDFIGTWKWDAPGQDGQMVPCSITFNADGTLEMDFAMDGQIETKGTFTHEGNVITIIETEGGPCVNKKGTYKLAVSGDTVTPEMVSEECDERKSGIPTKLTRVK